MKLARSRKAAAGVVSAVETAADKQEKPLVISAPGCPEQACGRSRFLIRARGYAVVCSVSAGAFVLGTVHWRKRDDQSMSDSAIANLSISSAPATVRGVVINPSKAPVLDATVSLTDIYESCRGCTQLRCNRFTWKIHNRECATRNLFCACAETR